ncbi:MAG: hypothetical protein D6785_13595 [Planctomycetota bacterium]|nr:MAG: hypothetical protein D6785_13595 [Planctomycetota bacterium]
MKKQKHLLLFLLFLFSFPYLAGCNKKRSTIITSLLSSKFPSDLDVPIISGSSRLNGSVAFVVQDEPFSIIPVDTNTGTLSFQFPITDLSFLKPNNGSIYGSDLFIASENLGAVVYTGNDSSFNHITGVAIFNPSTGTFLSKINCAITVSNTSNYKALDYSSSTNSVSYRTVSTFTSSFASGVVIIGNKLYVSTSNLDTSNYSTYYPGTVFVFDITSLTSPLYLATIFPGQDGGDPTIRYFNPTQLTLYGSKILLTSSGATEFDASFNSLAVSNGALEVIDPSTNTVTASYNLGKAGLNGEEVKIYSSGTNNIAVIGSQVQGHIYRVNLTTGTVMNSYTSNPIVVTSATTNEIISLSISQDQSYVFVASKANSKIYVLSLSSLDTNPSSPTVVQTKDPIPGVTSLVSPSNLETLVSQNNVQRAIYTTGDPPTVGFVSQ